MVRWRTKDKDRKGKEKPAGGNEEKGNVSKKRGAH